MMWPRAVSAKRRWSAAPPSPPEHSFTASVRRPGRVQGFKEAVNCGQLIGHPVEGCRVTLTDGAVSAHTRSSATRPEQPHTTSQLQHTLHW